jgi:hypothetical protein
VDKNSLNFSLVFNGIFDVTSFIFLKKIYILILTSYILLNVLTLILTIYIIFSLFILIFFNNIDVTVHITNFYCNRRSNYKDDGNLVLSNKL